MFDLFQFKNYTIINEEVLYITTHLGVYCFFSENVYFTQYITNNVLFIEMHLINSFSYVLLYQKWPQLDVFFMKHV